MLLRGFPQGKAGRDSATRRGVGNDLDPRYLPRHHRLLQGEAGGDVVESILKNDVCYAHSINLGGVVGLLQPILPLDGPTASGRASPCRGHGAFRHGENVFGNRRHAHGARGHIVVAIASASLWRKNWRANWSHRIITNSTRFCPLASAPSRSSDDPELLQRFSLTIHTFSGILAYGVRRNLSVRSTSEGERWTTRSAISRNSVGRPQSRRGLLQRVVRLGPDSVEPGWRATEHLDDRDDAD